MSFQLRQEGGDEVYGGSVSPASARSYPASSSSEYKSSPSPSSSSEYKSSSSSSSKINSKSSSSTFSFPSSSSSSISFPSSSFSSPTYSSYPAASRPNEIIRVKSRISYPSSPSISSTTPSFSTPSSPTYSSPLPSSPTYSNQEYRTENTEVFSREEPTETFLGESNEGFVTSSSTYRPQVYQGSQSQGEASLKRYSFRILPSNEPESFRQSESLDSISLGGPELFGQSEQSYENGQNDDIDEIISIGEDFSGFHNEAIADVEDSQQYQENAPVFTDIVEKTKPRVEDEKSLAEILEDNTPAGSEIVVEEEDAAEGDQASDFIDSTASDVAESNQEIIEIPFLEDAAEPNSERKKRNYSLYSTLFYLK
ncbi:putative protein TPRXL [Eurytemora carolleeae]|uniref:putative protein TPRXL n=1 Tax=Eurytemora carolleeae TaxID=1294199 RepID=UPI000C77BF3C|nr:putative protein TPRXL [Eurytemora carolleeae]|eukprot:XP_023345841.1 putative protein TPRXL [Eurytemora affinis]